jgi:glycerol-1-phosphate dehydrogenase [NAD(P)+]
MNHIQEMIVMSSIEPDTVVIKKGAIDALSDLLVEYHHPLIVTDQLIHSEYRKLVETTVQQDLVWLFVSSYEQGMLLDSNPVDIILGFGGGRSLDVAKLLAKDTNLNWISIPTAASHDGIASNVASVMQDGYKYSQKCKSPIAVIADLSIISRAPSKLRSAGIGDIICKASSLAEWRLAHEQKNEPFDKKVYSMVEYALESVLKDQSLESLVEAEVAAGRAMSIFGSSRPCSGTEHAISHAMDRRNHGLHGFQVAFATPICIHFLKKSGYTKYKTSDLREIMRNTGLSLTLQEMEMTIELFLDDIHHALRIMEKRGRYSVLKHLSLDDTDITLAIDQVGY